MSLGDIMSKHVATPSRIDMLLNPLNWGNYCEAFGHPDIINSKTLDDAISFRGAEQKIRDC